MQPDAAAGLAAALVQRVGVVDGQRPRTVEVLERLRVQVAGDVVHAQRCALVPFKGFFKSRLADRDVVVRDQLESGCRVLEQVQAGARGIHRNRMARARRQGQELRGNAAGRRAFPQGLEPDFRLLAKIGQHRRCGCRRGVGNVPEGAHGPGLAAQQVPVHQLCQLESGMVLHQAFRPGQGVAPPGLSDQAVDFNQPGFGLAGPWRGLRGLAGHGQCGARSARDNGRCSGCGLQGGLLRRSGLRGGLPGDRLGSRFALGVRGLRRRLDRQRGRSEPQGEKCYIKYS